MAAQDQEGALQAALQLIADELTVADRLIESALHSHAGLTKDLGGHLVGSGGKRLRPAVTILAARACGLRDNTPMELAAVVELIHTSTLLHDDVVDHAHRRRGRKAAHTIWGERASVLVGDFLYTRAFELLVAVGSLGAMAILSRATTAMAEGAILELRWTGDLSLHEKDCLDILERKTARLFEASTHMSALLAQAEPSWTSALAAYGLHLGMAFQLVDDVLDYHADPEVLGKEPGRDLLEGKMTMPMVHALQHSPQRATLHGMLGGRLAGDLEMARAFLEEAGSFDYTLQIARSEADNALQALSILPPSPFKDGLSAMARFALERQH